MARPARPGTAARGSSRTSRETWAHWSALALLVIFSVLQRPGETTFDTKFDLTADPGKFLERTLHLWNPWQNFGELQNQAYGYLFPQGPYFWLLDVMAVPDWVSQRLWSALLLVVAYDGCRRVHRALVPDRPVVSVVAGLAYATAPRLLGLSGVLSAEVLPTAMLPWVVLPLVLGVRGRLSPMAAGLWSGVPVLLMGGVNAVENLAALPLAFLVVLRGIRSAEGRKLAGFWVLATSLASLWWFLPLLVMGRYSPPFLNYIETAAATTRPLGWTNAVRGADHWLAFLEFGRGPWWPGAFDLAVSPALVVLTTLVAALSLFGLFSPSMPMRGTFAASALLGLVLLTIGHAGIGHSPLDGWVRELLDGPLAPLRNVHKVDPLVRLPFALGFAQTLLLAERLVRRDRLRTIAATRAFKPVALVLALGLLLASATPLFDSRLRKDGWSELPQAWHDVAAFLEDEGGGTALVLPGSGFGMQWWGTTIDQPIQGVASSPWVMRSQVPLVPGSTLRFLDAVETRIADGVGSPALSDTLAGAGIAWVVVRRDLDHVAAEAPTPSRVDAAMAASPGLELEQSFGRYGPLGQPMIDVYRVDLPVPEAEAPLVSALAHASGGPEDLITAREAEVLEPRRRAVFGDPPPDVVGDGFRKQERQFGRLSDSLSDVLTRDEPYRTLRREHDYAGVTGQRRVVAEYRGATAVTASSSAGYVDALGPIRPEVGPFAAVDGDPRTYWQSAPLEDPEGQWVEVRLGQEATPRGVNVFAGVDSISGVPVRRVRVTAGDQERVVGIDPVSGQVRVPLDGSPVDRVRVTVVEVAGSPPVGVAAIREIAALGVPIARRLVLPDSGATGSTAFVFSAQPPRRACVPTALGPACAVGDARARLEQLEMRRAFTVHGRGRWDFSGTVTARPTSEAAALLNPVGPGVRAVASSTLANDLLVSPRFAVDGDPATPWVADVNDTSPLLRLRWGTPRRISRIQLDAAPGDYLRPVSAVLRAAGETRTVDLTDGGFGYFEPFRTRTLDIAFVAPRSVAAPRSSLAVGELRVDGIEDLVRPVDPASPTGAPCGLGPEVVVDGTRYRTEVTGTVDDLLRGAPLDWRGCDGPVTLAAGEHEAVVESTVQYAAGRLALVPRLAGRAADGAVPATRPLTRTGWSATTQSYEIDAGEAALLRVPQNVNEGWVAELDGERLDPVAVDGWQQGYQVPAGGAATIEMRFVPDLWYRLGLLVGLVAALALLAVSVWVWRRAPCGSGTPLDVRRGPRPSPGGMMALVAVILAVGWLLGGPFVAVGIGLALGVRLRMPRAETLLVAAGALLVALSGVVAAWWPDTPGMPGPVADVLAAAAVGVLGASLVTLPARRVTA